MKEATDKYIVERLIANDPVMIEEFFFRRCRKALAYIGEYFCRTKEPAENLIGEFYVYLSENDWHKLRIFKFTCSLTAYVAVIATRYFQNKRDTRIGYYGKEPWSLLDNSTEPRDPFTQNDICRLVAKMKPLDRFLVERILIGGDKPGDVLEEAKRYMDDRHLGAMNKQQFAGYIYTRYARARRHLQEELILMGYGA